MKGVFDVFSVAFSLPFTLLKAFKVDVFALPAVLREADILVVDELP